MNGLDATARPPKSIQEAYKLYRKPNSDRLSSVEEFDDPSKCESFFEHSRISAEVLNTVFQTFLSSEAATVSKDARVYASKIVPGLRIVPNALTPAVQKTLLAKLLHRDLSVPHHLTNLHKFYHVQYPTDGDSFFSIQPSERAVCNPKDPTLHKPLSVQQFLTKKLRWMTIGGQYDWTAKVYPDEKPPLFSADVAHLVQALFPDMKPEAAIVNLYSPGNTLSMHRDVAEFCSAGLVSVSIGCDAVFVVGLDAQPGDPEGESRVQVLRLKSGDAVYMTGPSRFAWHGVPQVVDRTCPEWLNDWPAGEEADEDGNDPYAAWKGWMETKRINLNVRQMWETGAEGKSWSMKNEP